MDEKIIDGKWKCNHEGGHSTTLREYERLEKPPHYVICPDCGTHWIVWKYGFRRLAKPVIIPVSG
jgi:hypothetical protein